MYEELLKTLREEKVVAILRDVPLEKFEKTLDILKEEGIKFINKEEELGKHIISAQINTNLKEVKNTPLKYFKEIRDFSIKIIQFIQVFSKTIEHHKSYLIDSLHYIKRKEFDNMEFAKTIL